MYIIFVRFDSLRPRLLVKKISVMSGRVFIGWINTKPRINVSLKDTPQWLHQWIYSNQQLFGLQTNALPTEWAAALSIVPLD